jgi:hypothetical protein
MIRPKILLKETDLVYNFYKTLTVVEESENNDTDLSFKVGPKASSAI